MSRVLESTPDFSLYQKRSADSRRTKDRMFVVICLVTAIASVVILAALLITIGVQGAARLNPAFLEQPPSPDADKAGIMPAFYGTIWVCLICAMFTLPIGVATAVMLEEFKPRRGWLLRVHGFVQINIANLAGVPSVVYGIIGLTTFVSFFGLLGGPKEATLEFGVQYQDQFLTLGDEVVFVDVAKASAPPTEPAEGMLVTLRGKEVELHVVERGQRLPEEGELRKRTVRSTAKCGRVSAKAFYYLRVPFGRGVLAGSLTLMLVVLPIVIVASQESLRAVPDSLREGARGLGATTWQVVRNVTLPAAAPGVMTGSILAMSRAIGEAAPFLIIAGIVYIATPPGHLMDDFTVMPLQIYNWAQRPQSVFHEVAASGIIVLLAILLTFNAVAIFIRQRLQKPLS